MAVGYVAIVLVIAFCVIPERAGDVHYLAPRYLGSNTRLAGTLFVLPTKVWVEDRLRLARERSQLEKRYVKKSVDAGAALTPDNVSVWPELSEDAVPVEVDNEPDWMLLNQGTKVELWIGDKPEPQHTLVLAIVPSGDRWMALLSRQGLVLNSPGSAKRTLRIEALPGAKN
jgi:hypothetical protein